MAVRDRVRKYRETGGASDLVRVEVLVPASKRDAIVAEAAAMRSAHRDRKQRVAGICAKAIEQYPVRLLDNIDLGRISDPLKQGAVVARALMERGDARAFAMGRQILAELEA
ncbi:hypothetical protein [Mesorhizobium marinum]|uniref:Uncharacterized protein n=1 Tax=Mesorhizobium marinum TaxID=3228790 RepID=A0ABV3QXM9_9HYPH